MVSSVSIRSNHSLMVLFLILILGLERHTVKSWSSAWFQVPTGTSWSMLHEVRIPFGKTSITLSIPVRYKFDNTSTMALERCENVFCSTGRVAKSEQEDIFNTIEDTLHSFGLDGKSCLLRAICEINESPMRDLTMIGEIFTLILTPRRSFQERSFLLEYLKAEDIGRHKGNCWQNYYSCPFSIRHFLAGMQYVR